MHLLIYFKSLFYFTNEDTRAWGIVPSNKVKIQCPICGFLKFLVYHQLFLYNQQVSLYSSYPICSIEFLCFSFYLKVMEYYSLIDYNSIEI